jgi:putative ABC transport system permease protein
MARHRMVLGRLLHRLRRPMFERQIGEEIETHVDMLTDDYVARGLSPDAARRAARLRLGGVEQTMEAVRDQRAMWLDRAGQEVRHALRSFRRSPGFTAIAVLTLGLAVALTTSIFSLVDAVLLRDLPYRDPERLVALWATRPQDPSARDQQMEARVARRIFVANTLLDVWRRGSTSFEEVGGFRDRSFTVATRTEPQQVNGAVTTTSFFRVLGLRPLLGRVFVDGEDVPGRDEVVVLGHTFWRDAFGADPTILGRSIRVDGRPHTVIGVLGPEVRLPLQYTLQQPSLYTPMSHEFAPGAPFSVLLGIARLKPGVSRTGAQAELTSVMSDFSTSTGRYRRSGVNVASLADEVVETAAGTRRGLLTLFGAIGCVLLMACANVANLLLVRAVGRHHELSVRMALGAGRWRLVRQMVIESLLLSTAAGALGLLLTDWTLTALVAAMPATLFPRIEEVRIDAAVLAFAVGVAVVAGLLASVAPGWYATGRGRGACLPDWLHNDGHGTSGRGARLVRRALVTIDVALATVLLVGAGLLGRTYLGLRSTDLGVQSDHAITFRLSPAAEKYQAGAARLTLAEDILARLRTVNGVTAAGAVESLPIMSFLSEARVTIGADPSAEPAPVVSVNRATAGFFEAAGIPIVLGRAFEPSGTAESVALVNRSMAGRLPNGGTGASVVGEFLSVANASYRICGVVGDVKYRGPEGRVADVVYLPLASSPPNRLSVVVRTTGPPEGALRAVSAAVHSSDPDLPVEALQTMEDLRAAVLAPQRFRFAVIGLFAGVAMLLAVIGLYGVIAQSVSERTREIGVRLALGAVPGRIVRLVLREALLLAGLGVALGTLAATGAARVLTTVLVGVGTFDRVSYSIVAAALVAVAALAGYLPARRASAIDPVRALRVE